MNNIKSKISFVLIFTMIITLLGIPSLDTTHAQGLDLSVKVKKTQDIDVSLSVSESVYLDISTFEGDLKESLKERGISSDNVKITTVKTSEVSAEGSGDFQWKTYDHWTTDPWSYYKDFSYNSVPEPVGSTGSPYKHTWVYDSGKKIIFYGYKDRPFKDLMYMPNDSSTKKIFTFTMDDSNINNHSMLGGGFLFNANITNIGEYAQNSSVFQNSSTVDEHVLQNQFISGYILLLIKDYSGGSYPALYKVDNMSMYDFHHSYGYMTPIVSDSSKKLSGVHNIRIEVDGSSFKMWDTVGQDISTLQYNELEDTGAYGFGPMAHYTSHGCSRLSWFTFENLQMFTTRTKTFLEVIREAEWRDNTQRFVVNLDDDTVSDFENSDTNAEILTRFGNDNIHYIGWGNDSNESQGNQFIMENNDKGTFVNKDNVDDTYGDSIDAIADYIAGVYPSPVEDVDYVTYGSTLELNVEPSSFATGQDGKWKVNHQPTYQTVLGSVYDPSGSSLYSNETMDDLDLLFNEAGQYDIYYENTVVKSVYVHRQPISSFNVEIDGGLNAVYNDNSFDPDAISHTGKGIFDREWKWRKATEISWHNGKPSNPLNPNQDYMISLRVMDDHGIWSLPTVQYISTKGLSEKPIAEFSLSATRLHLNSGTRTVQIIDRSQDIDGKTILDREWLVTKDGESVASNITVLNAVYQRAFDTPGNYVISLKVTNSDDEESQWFSRSIEVLNDNTPPSVNVSPNSGSYNLPKDVNLTFSDDSGLLYQKYTISESTNTPSEEQWSVGEENSIRTINLYQSGSWYIHYKAKDRAGNTITGSFGPYTVSDSQSPSNPTIIMTTLPDNLPYSNGAITDKNVKVILSGSTDNSGSVVYEYRIGNGEWIEGSTVTIADDGNHILYYRASDLSGNKSSQFSRYIRIDKGSPIILGVENDGKYNTNKTPDSNDTDISTVTLTKDGENVSGYTLGTELTSDGEYSLTVTDANNNSTSLSFVIDKTQPVIIGTEDGKTHNEYPTISFSDEMSGIKSAQLDGETFESGAQITEDGEYTLVVEDNFGNITTVNFTIEHDDQVATGVKENLVVNYHQDDNENRVAYDVGLLTEGEYNTVITWTSSHPNIIGNDGKLLQSPSEDTEVTLTATITKGDEVKTKVFKVTVLADRIPPTVTLTGQSNVSVNKGELYVESGYQAEDNVDGDLTTQVTITGTLNTNAAGVYTLSYNVEDSSGNRTVVTRNITVVGEEVDNDSKIDVANEEDIDDTTVESAVNAAKNKGKSKIQINVNEKVEEQNEIKVSISKNQVENAKDNDFTVVLQTQDVSIEVPMKAVNTSRMGTNARLELVVTHVDTSHDPEMEAAVKDINQSMDIYENKIFDFKMKVVEEDEAGNVVKDEEIENFTSADDITLRMVVGAVPAGKTLLTFYYNEQTGQWEYIRGIVDGTSVIMKTKHLSIYSVMHLTKEEKQNELTDLISTKPNITIEEVLNIIEDPDMELADGDGRYNNFSSQNKEYVAQEIINDRPYGIYGHLATKYNTVVQTKTDEIASVGAKITLNGLEEMTLYVGQTYTEPGATAVNASGNDVTGSIIIMGNVDTSVTGEYTITYKVTNPQLEETRTVKVINRSSGSSSKAPVKQQPDDKLEIITGKDNLSTEKITDLVFEPKDKEMKIVSDIYELKFDKKSDDLQGQVKIKYDEENGVNENRLGVFIYDENTQAWKYLGGKVDKEANEITLDVSVSGKITIMEYDKTFDDVKGHWAQDSVELLASRQILTGDGDGNFRPNWGITRAEFATLIVKTLGIEPITDETGFEDVQESDWFAPYIAAARTSGVVKGISDTEYQPYRIVNRQEMTAMVIRAFKNLEETPGDYSRFDIDKFEDDNNIGNWAKNDVYLARYLNLVKGRTEDLFVPTSETTRAEAATLIYRFLESLGEI